MGTNGLVLGKFYPPHRGHEHLIRFADAYCDTLFVVLGSLASENIPGALRVSWMKEIFPNIEILHLDQELPQYPEEHPYFWALWKKALGDLIPAPLDFVFTSEAYGEALADNLDAAWVSIDAGRETVDISATKIRDNPNLYWDYLADPVKPYYRKRIVICGPESAGKTTLTKRLATHFDTRMVPEYARQYLERKGGEIVFSDMEKIARGQEASQCSLAYHSGPYVFCDTDARATRLWSQALFGKTNAAIEEIANRSDADLYLLCHPDIAFEDDPIRYQPEKRDVFFSDSKCDLVGKNVVEIFGPGEQRFELARQAVLRSM